MYIARHNAHTSIYARSSQGWFKTKSFQLFIVSYYSFVIYFKVMFGQNINCQVLPGDFMCIYLSIYISLFHTQKCKTIYPLLYLYTVNLSLKRSLLGLRLTFKVGLKSKSLHQSGQPVVKIWILALLYIKLNHNFVEAFPGLKG